ncbi:hypothetical protein NPIL_527661, partial [Nephila pilipes]
RQWVALDVRDSGQDEVPGEPGASVTAERLVVEPHNIFPPAVVTLIHRFSMHQGLCVDP